jgi:AbrB family looped-hinge helix DNA binding protein
MDENTVVIARVTSKGQVTIPHDVREALDVGPGDSIAWEVDTRGVAIVRRVRPIDFEYLRGIEGSLSEWSGAADEEAYRDL